MIVSIKIAIIMLTTVETVSFQQLNEKVQMHSAIFNNLTANNG